MELADIADGVLVQRALTGDQQAFETLIQRYNASLCHFIYHYVQEYHEACDVLQQVWLQLYISLAMLRQHGQLKSWLLKVLVTPAEESCVAGVPPPFSG